MPIRPSHALAALAPVLALSLALAAQDGPARPGASLPRAGPPAVDRLAWMSGAWESVRGETRVEEHWTHPAGGTLLGVGRTIAGERTVAFEFLRVETRKEGLVLVAQPMGRAGTDFALVEADADHAVFANPAHDFPKRVVYRRDGPDGLVARVEGAGDEPGKAEEFRYRRRGAN